MKRCYYQILQVDRKATATEIKQSYRKLALKYHPDKNPDQDTKHKFVQINEAYNVLSDVNQRTWYDNNREKILFNKDQMSKEDLEQYSFGFNIWNYFTMNCFEGFGDNPEGFYAVYRDVFEKIKAEEAKAFNNREDIEEQYRKYEGFGDSTTPEERMLKFYEDWQNFTTYKTFVWSEEWDTREAGNRWMRRQMEKQNKKQRQGEKKTYIKTIKDLVAYVKKRDPRFREYQMRLKEEEQKKMQEKLEREKQKKIEKEQMKHVKQKLEEERFKEIQEYFKKQNEDVSPQKNFSNNYEQEDIDKEFYCEICEKGFKSQNQLRNHQKSKQHKQMVKNIQKQVMLKEQIIQKAQEEKEETQVIVEEKKDSPAKKKNKKKKKNQQAQKQQSEEEEEEKKKPEPKVQARKQQTPPKEHRKQESQSDDDDAFMSTLLNNRKKAPKEAPKQVPKEAVTKKEGAKKNNPKPILDSEDEEQQTKQEGEKIGKAKLKKQKKAEQQKAGKSNQLKCNVCNEAFTSKTKLFDHINKSGHASAK